MIVEAILHVIYQIVVLIWGLVPPWTMPIPDEVGQTVFEISKWDAYVPVTELFLAVSATGVVFGVTMVLKWGWKIIQTIRGSG